MRVGLIERAHHDACRAALAAMRSGADRRVVTGEEVSASGADTEALGHRLRGRAKARRGDPRQGP